MSALVQNGLSAISTLREDPPATRPNGLLSPLQQNKTLHMRVLAQTTCRIELHSHGDSRRSFNTASTQAVRLSDALFKYYK